jgi:two-component system phosphate regulon response regulator PhoB
VQGFEAGADDYVAKPFSSRELMLRVRALLRRSASSPSADTARAAPIAIDRDRHEVRVHGQLLRLTALEFRLLATLLARAGHVQRREVLLVDVWGVRPDLNTRTVDTHVKRLRERLGSAGDCIHTVRGVGYCLRWDEGETAP